MKDHLSYLIGYLLKKHSISIDFDELEFQVQTHPTYPSLHAVTSVLDHFNIDNLALDVPITPNTLEHLPHTFLAQIEEEGHKQFAIATPSSRNYHLVFDKKKQKTMSADEFLEKFTGIILVVEKDEAQAQPNTSKIRNLLVNGLLYAAAIISTVLAITSHYAIHNILFLSLSIVGTYISYAILKQELGETTVLGNAFCSNPSEKKDCNAVLSSKGATIIEGLKLSDLSFMYFAGLALATFFNIHNASSNFVPMLISLAALPITVYSIYYQSTVIKKWCFLCLSIVALIWSQAALSLLVFSPVFNLQSVLTTALSFAAISGTWLIISKYMKDNKDLYQLKLAHFKFKRNYELFESQLSKSQYIDTRIDGLNEIVFGNIQSTFEITVVTNPLCGHCKAVHEVIQQILKGYSQSVKLRIRFNIRSKDLKHKGVKITTRLLDLYDEDSHRCLKAMDDIYSTYTSKEWLKKWEACPHPEIYLPILERAYAWCTDNSINFTPEILINGRSYPKIYDRKDLIYFIDDLLEQYKANNYNVPYQPAESI